MIILYNRMVYCTIYIVNKYIVQYMVKMTKINNDPAVLPAAHGEKEIKMKLCEILKNMNTETAIIVHIDVFNARFSTNHFPDFYLSNADLREKDVRSIWVENSKLNIALK